MVKAAKEMGAQYIVLTAKHHGGFFLYDTKGLSDFDVMHSPARRDVVREFVDACHAEDNPALFYTASYDWRSPLYTQNFDSYRDYLQASVELLWKHYGPNCAFWCDFEEKSKFYDENGHKPSVPLYCRCSKKGFLEE